MGVASLREDEILRILKEGWEERKKEKMSEMTDGDEEEAGEDGKLLLDAVKKEADNIATVKKENVFKDDLTEEEQDIINKRVELQRKQYHEWERREYAKKTKKILSVHRHLTEQEAEYALKELRDDEQEATVELTDRFFLAGIRKKIALDAQAADPKYKPNMRFWHNREKQMEQRKQKKRKREHLDEFGNKLKKKKRYNAPKLKLDDAINQESMEGWSSARKRAYKLIKENPNAFVLPRLCV